MKSFDGKELKKAKDKRDYINKLSRSELFNECKNNNIKVSREKNDELRKKLKNYYYKDLEDYEVKLLNKEEPLTDKEIDLFITETLNKLYKESQKPDNSNKPIDSDLRLINAMRGRK